MREPPTSSSRPGVSARAGTAADAAALYTADPDRDRQNAAAVARILALREGETAVLGLGVSGVAAARLLRHNGFAVYASDGTDSEATRVAARELEAVGVSCDIGVHDLGRIAAASLVVVSPGIAPEAPPVARARAAKVPVVSEVEVGLRLMPGVRTIAVTGTNGKTTTTALIGHLMRSLGQDTVDAGNIGVAVSAVAMRAQRPSWLALEVSSFQLHDTPGLQPDVGVLTALSPDHLDRYPSVQAYYADKARLFANAESGSRWVVTADSTDVDRMCATVPGITMRFSLHVTDVESWYDRTQEWLVVAGEPFMARAEVPLLGDHNVANVLAAATAVCQADLAHRTPAARAQMASAIRGFRALPHRLEPVHEANGCLWVNDSKATNMASTLVAIEGMARPTILLLGGRHKGEPYTALAEPLARVGKVVLCFGEAGAQAARDLRAALAHSDVIIEQIEGTSFEPVMRRAHELAEPGDVVLLSPACSSYDMFPNYIARGERFAELARSAG